MPTERELARLYDDHAPALFAFLLNLMRNEADARARLVAAGEKLTVREILGPEIPAVQNAGAAAVFAPFFDYHRTKPGIAGIEDGQPIYSSGLIWPQSNQLARWNATVWRTANIPNTSNNWSRNSPRVFRSIPW